MKLNKVQTFHELELHLLETKHEGKEWKIVVIQAGLSKNGKFYPEDVLKEAVPLFDGVKVNSFSLDGNVFDHLGSLAPEMENQGPRLVRNIVGVLENPTYETFSSDGITRTGIVATFKIFDNAEWLKKLLLSAFKEGQVALFGFSIDAAGTGVEDEIDGRRVIRVISIAEVSSVDIVSHPAAGGKIVKLVASEKKKMNRILKLLESIKKARPAWLGDLDISAVTEENAKETLKGLLESCSKLATDKLAKTPVKDKEFADAAFEAALFESCVKNLDGDKIDTVCENLEGAMKEKDPESKVEVKESKAGNVEVTVVLPVAAKESVKVETKPDDETAKKVAAIEEGIALRESMSLVKEALSESKLPKVSKARVIRLCEGRKMNAEDVEKVVAEERKYLESLSGDGQVTGLGKPKEESVEVLKETLDKQKDAMYGMLIGETVNKVTPYASLHESFRLIEGVSGTPTKVGEILMANMHFSQSVKPTNEKELGEWHKKLKESLAGFPIELREAIGTGSWAEVFGDSIRRALMREYGAVEGADGWRKIPSVIGSLKDFRTNRRIRIGGFDDLDTVGELGTYTEFVDVTDEEATYAVQKRGNLHSISMEAIVNDDLGAIQRLPRKYGRAAARTLSKFVFNLIFSNAVTTYDSVALANAAHGGNLGTVALAYDALLTRIKNMRKQIEKDSLERIGISPRFLMVPVDLEDTAWSLLESTVKIGSTERETAPNTVRGKYKLEMLLNPWVTDATDWWLMADPRAWDTMEVGFLNGRQDPELFIQDQPMTGAVFTADKITYKIRHTYGAAVLDHRAFDGNVVA